MAFGITRRVLKQWKEEVSSGEIAFLTHFWLDDRFPNVTSVTKVGCNDLPKLINWGKKHGLRREWIHVRADGYSHFDLLGDTQRIIMAREGRSDQLAPFTENGRTDNGNSFDR